MVLESQRTGLSGTMGTQENTCDTKYWDHA